LAAPVQLAPNVVRPKSSTVQCDLKALAGLPKTFSAAPACRGMPIEPWRAANTAFGHARFHHFNPGMSGVTRNAVTFQFSLLSERGA